MNPEIFAEWLRRQGRRVVRSESSYWYEAGPLAFQAFPYHRLIQPKETELIGLLRRHRVAALRYSTPVDAPPGSISYHAIYEHPVYTLESLDRRSRQNVRTGLASCRVEPIPLARLAVEGWLLELDTAERQGRRILWDKEAWRIRCEAAADLPGFEAWGALVGDRLVASLLTFQMGDCCELISQQCLRDYLSNRVNNAIVFVVTQEMVKRPGVRSIFYTLQSLDAPASIDEFKFRMGYQPKPVLQRVVFHPWLAHFVNGASHRVVRKLLGRAPGNPVLSKIEGMMRFYLTGRKPLSEQDWPACLGVRRSEMLGRHERTQNDLAYETR